MEHYKVGIGFKHKKILVLPRNTTLCGEAQSQNIQRNIENKLKNTRLKPQEIPHFTYGICSRTVSRPEFSDWLFGENLFISTIIHMLLYLVTMVTNTSHYYTKYYSVHLGIQGS